MVRLVFLILGVGPAAVGNINLANIAALVVAVGTATAGAVAYFRLRQDRPKVIQEVAGLAESRLRDELRTAWEAVDRLRTRETELERRVDELEAERDALLLRLTACERIMRDAGLGGAPA